MTRSKVTSALPLLNSAVAFVVLIPVMLIAISVTRENLGLRGEVARLGGVSEPHDQPPIIVLRESEGFSFPSGSANISSAFGSRLLSTIIPTLHANIEKYHCDIIEVIGHTDSQRVAASSTTDADLLSFIRGSNIALSPGSNADLGLMRAWSVLLFLQEKSKWTGIKFYGYSAAQAIDPSGSLVDLNAPEVNEHRRRIEIRVRCSK